ncbi:Alpha-amylase 1 [bacterium HR30]|nr:Alpha-amylase 1 [bacterium HR30]
MGSTTRYICIHGHFYQPPRENPWLEAIEVQDSAAPYHDWNERVTAECYEPNVSARVLDPRGRITTLRNNYSAISFNFGPTLLAWLEREHPELYAEVLRADAEGKERYGCGNAMAQVYGHAILPLASPRDQVTQVRWGIEDFVYRFGRAPEGMWLPETAVDDHALAVLADHKIRYTILAPHQARRVSYGGGPWQDIHGEGIDPSRPYRCELGHGRSIVVFFYDGPLARGIAFEGWLRDGRALAAKLVTRALSVQENGLVHVATDGETYGHHHRFGEMALAAALEALEQDERISLTNYGAYLRHVEVPDRVEVRPFTSWSCVHGVERWRAGCSCHAGHASWQHEWRGPLRETLDWLKGELDNLFEREGGRYLTDPWEARNAYIRVLLRDTDEERESFLAQHARRTLQREERVQVWKLLEMQRHALLMFTSCGWFFDDPSGLETTQVLTYAARAMQLAEHFGCSLFETFLQRLRPMRSNLPQYRDGADVFERLVRPRMSDQRRVVAHYAMNALFDPPPAVQKMYAYRFVSQERVFDTGGTPSFSAGKVELYERATEESSLLDYAAVHLGGHDFFCVVDHAQPSRDSTWLRHMLQTFRTQPIVQLLRELEQKFPSGHFTLADVFVAERRRILHQITSEVLARASRLYERIVRDNRRLIEFLVHNELELPEELRIAMRFVVRRNWETRVQEFAAGTAELDELVAVADNAARWALDVDKEVAAQVLGRALADAVACIGSAQGEKCYRRARAILEAGQRLELAVELRWAQNLFFRLIHNHDAAAAAISRSALQELGEALGFAMDVWRNDGEG